MRSRCSDSGITTIPCSMCQGMEVTVLVAPLGGLLAQLTGYGHVAGHLIVTPSGLMAVAVGALTCVLAGFLARSAWTARKVTIIPLRSRATALRAQSRRTAFLRQRDPDSAGRRRPRAPTALPAAA
jgi:hypothetical protein